VLYTKKTSCICTI